MIALVFAAGAHSVGGHPVLHSLDWSIRSTSTDVHYEVEVPAAFVRGPGGIEGLQRELTGALQLRIDGDTTPLTVDAAEVSPTQHGALFSFDLRGPVPPGVHALELSNGNLPDTTSLHRTSLRIGPAVDLVDSSLLVEHEGVVVRSDSGRTVANPSARRVQAKVHTPRNRFESLHRALQGRSIRGPREAQVGPLLSENRSTVWMMGLAPLLGLLALPAPRPGRAVWAGLFTIACLDLGTTTALSAPLVFVALMSAVLASRSPNILWLCGPALAASLDLRGISIPVMALQLVIAGRIPPRFRSTAAGLGALIALVQATRIGAEYLNSGL